MQPDITGQGQQIKYRLAQNCLTPTRCPAWHISSGPEGDPLDVHSTCNKLPLVLTSLPNVLHMEQTFFDCTFTLNLCHSPTWNLTQFSLPLQIFVLLYTDMISWPLFCPFSITFILLPSLYFIFLMDRTAAYSLVLTWLWWSFDLNNSS